MVVARKLALPRLLAGSLLALTLGLYGLGACAPEPDKELARALIGPEGGTLSGGGVTVEIPAGALPAETELVLLEVDRKLSVGEFEQKGKTYAIEPADLRLYLPAEVTLPGSAELPSVLAESRGRVVAFSGSTAYVEYLGALALAETGSATIGLVEPSFGPTPMSPGDAFVDNLHVELQLEGTHRVDLVITAWDYSQGQGQLNGMKGHCGFKLAQLEGGSLTTGCAQGELSASINAAGDRVSFDILPLHAPKLEQPVVVGVIALDEELGYSLGYFEFSTGSCYLEECSGHGTCEPSNPPGCVCDEGFAPPADDPLSCACVPQCEGRECGSDSCGGSCGDCAGGETCVSSEGQCVPEGGDGDGDTTETTDDTTDTTDDTTEESTTDTTDTDTSDTGTDTTG